MTVSKLPRLPMPRAAVDDLTLIVPPVLREPQRAAVLQFVDDYEHYRLQGGKNRVRKCMSSDLQTTLGLMGVNTKDKAAGDDEELGQKDDDRFIEEMQALFAPTSIDDAYASLEAVVMKSKATVDAAAMYASRFNKARKLAEVKMTLKPKKLRKLFEAGIRPAYLAKLVSHEECETWEESCRELVKHAREQETTSARTRRYTEQDETGSSSRSRAREPPPRVDSGAGDSKASGNAWGSGSQPPSEATDKDDDEGRDSAPVGGTKPTDSGSGRESQVLCYKCGEYGHYQSRCKASAEKQKTYLDRRRAELGDRPSTLRSAG